MSTADLQARGILSPLTGVASREAVDTAGVHTRAGEFVISELDQVATDPECVARIAKSIVRHSEGRRAILGFAVSIDHALLLSEALTALGCAAAAIHGGMAPFERDSVLSNFAAGRARALVNCQILTTGYDYPGIDCIACVRPTQSMGLWCQMVGRALRTAEGKQDALILDYGGNWARHGRQLDGLPAHDVVDEPAEDAEKARREAMAKSYRYPFKLATDEDAARAEARVYDIDFRLQQNRRQPGISQIMVTYRTDLGLITIWLLPEHPARARWHSEKWFKRRALAMPASATAALALARLAPLPESIHAVRDGDFWRVRIEHF